MISKVRDTIIWKSCDHNVREKNMFKQKDVREKNMFKPWKIDNFDYILYIIISEI